MKTLIDKYIATADKTETILYTGSVISVKGMLIESNGPQSVMGEICTIQVPIQGTNKFQPVLAEVVGLDLSRVQLMAYEETKGIEIGTFIIKPFKVKHLNSDLTECNNYGYLIYSKVTKNKTSGIVTSVKIYFQRSVIFMIYIGIDIAKNSHFASAVNSDGEVLVEPFKFSNDKSGFEYFINTFNLILSFDIFKIFTKLYFFRKR